PVTRVGSVGEESTSSSSVRFETPPSPNRPMEQRRTIRSSPGLAVASSSANQGHLLLENVAALMVSPSSPLGTRNPVPVGGSGKAETGRAMVTRAVSAYS